MKITLSNNRLQIWTTVESILSNNLVVKPLSDDVVIVRIEDNFGNELVMRVRLYRDSETSYSDFEIEEAQLFKTTRVPVIKEAGGEKP